MAKGIVSGTNPPENKGTIKASINGEEKEFVYNVKAGHTQGGYQPKEGHRVDFIPDEVNKVATGIKRDDPMPPSARLSASASIVEKGSRVQLTYSTDPNAKSAIIMPEPGEVPVGDGVVTVVVEADTTYKLTVTNADGSMDVVSVTVFIK